MEGGGGNNVYEARKLSTYLTYVLSLIYFMKKAKTNDFVFCLVSYKILHFNVALVYAYGIHDVTTNGHNEKGPFTFAYTNTMKKHNTTVIMIIKIKI